MVEETFFYLFLAPLLWILCLVDDSTDLPAIVHFLQIPFLRHSCGDLEELVQDQINGLKQPVPTPKIQITKQPKMKIEHHKKTNNAQHQYL